MDESVKLIDVIKLGGTIKTKHAQSKNWINNVVLSMDNKYIAIDFGLGNEYLKCNIMVGDTVKCRYFTDDKEYILSGWITDIDTNFPQKITIRIHEVESHTNQREYFRYDVNLCCVIKAHQDDKDGVFTVMTNISAGGAALALKKDISEDFMLKEDEVLRKAFYFDVYILNDKTFCFKGEIVRRKCREQGIEYGVKLVQIDKANSIIFDNFIKELESKDKVNINKSSFWTRNSKYFNG